jgi:hypothetical protein
MLVADKRCLLLAVGFAVYFAAALWLRLSSLGAFPWHDADESYYGVQIARLLCGESFEVLTVNKNVINPFFVGLQVPLQMVARPSLWVLRAPAAFSGVLAVILAYVIGRRVLDRTTALIAAALLATVPCVVYQSRIGLEMSQLPLFGLIVIAMALRGHATGLLLAFLASMLVHPTDIFLIPIALPVFLVQFARKLAAREDFDPARRRRLLISAAVGTPAVIAAVSAVIFFHPMAQIYFNRRPPLDWGRFVDGYERVLFCLQVPLSKGTIHIYRWGFRGVMAVLLILGTARLAWQRRWERLALVAGLAASLVTFHFVAGPRMLRDVTPRYGVVFMLPMVLAVACLLEGMLASPSSASVPREPTRQPLRRLPLAVGLVLSLALLLGLKQTLIDRSLRDEGESLWTFQPDGEDQYERALALIRRDLAERGRAAGIEPTRGTLPPTGVIVHDYWALTPLAYLASSSNDLELMRLIDPDRCDARDLDRLCREKQRELGDRLRTGAYAIHRVGVPVYAGGTVIEDTVNSEFTEGQVRRWTVPARTGGAALIVYRLEDDAPRLGARPPAATAAPAGVRR